MKNDAPTTSPQTPPLEPRNQAPGWLRSQLRKTLRHFVIHLGSLAIAAGALIAYEHFKLTGPGQSATGSLVTAALFGLSPVRALVNAVFAVPRRLLHLAHGLGGLAVVGLCAGGVVSGAPLLDRAAMAPFAIMGAAQAIMHQDHPRTREQAQALRTFATSLPEVEALSRPEDLATPQGAARAVAVLTDLVGEAEILGETELRSDPAFQSAWAQVSTRFGLTLGLDAIERATRSLSDVPSARQAAEKLQRRIDGLRRELR